MKLRLLCHFDIGLAVIAFKGDTLEELVKESTATKYLMPTDGTEKKLQSF